MVYQSSIMVEYKVIANASKLGYLSYSSFIL
jgi:hypothetical protein